jgi:UDP-N-acetylglucosamine transferase subunit ALG13
VTLVVVSVGTDHHRFDRLLDWAEQAEKAAVGHFVVQRGSTPARPGLETFDYLPSEQLQALMRDADAVVCHGGPGTISLACGAGHRPIVVPRDPSLGEHVDDHQMRYAERQRAQGRIDVANEPAEFLALLARPRPRVDDPDHPDGAAAIQAFAEVANRVLAGDMPRRPWRTRMVLRRTP